MSHISVHLICLEVWDDVYSKLNSNLHLIEEEKRGVLVKTLIHVWENKPSNQEVCSV